MEDHIPSTDMSAAELAKLTLSEAPEPAELSHLDRGGRPSASAADKRKGAWGIVIEYLKNNSAELRELDDLRQKGWKSTEADAYFQNQRKVADTSKGAEGRKTATYFYYLMQKIGNQLQYTTSAFTISSSGDQAPRVLDLCMAPGGFLETALKVNPRATAVAFSLPMRQGGHRCMMPQTDRVTKHYLDITMLAADMGTSIIPPDHPEAENFLPQQLPAERVFDLVLCDGQVLRTHELMAYRQECEARRLSATQLALGLERLRPGGTLVCLMHRVEGKGSAHTLHTFSKFAKVTLLKPTVGHAKKSSFYLVASDVRSESPEALAAVEQWKKIWRAATFPGGETDQDDRDGEADEGGRGIGWPDGGGSAEDFIEKFGPDLLRLGAPIWKIQAQALAAAPFMKNSAAKV